MGGGCGSHLPFPHPRPRRLDPKVRCSVAARYFARQRFYRGVSPNLTTWAVVFATDELSDDESRTLQKSVQQFFDELEKESEESFCFELGPSAEENPAVFINLKHEWDSRKGEIQDYASTSNSGTWRGDIWWFYSVACEHEEIIRDMRAGELPTVYLQCDCGGGFESFGCVDSLTWNELETLEELLEDELHAMGYMFRLVTDWHAEREPATFIRAKLSLDEYNYDVSAGTADDWRLNSDSVADKCINEIKRLRAKPVVYGQEDDDQHESDVQESKTVTTSGVAKMDEAVAANEASRRGYRDPDNYWRNVWLYEQRKANNTNAVILAALRARGNEFAYLDSENALRAAIDSIAEYHRWPVLKGKPGRPKATNAKAKSRSGNPNPAVGSAAGGESAQ
jgi:hypothetical protein